MPSQDSIAVLQIDNLISVVNTEIADLRAKKAHISKQLKEVTVTLDTVIIAKIKEYLDMTCAKNGDVEWVCSYNGDLPARLVCESALKEYPSRLYLDDDDRCVIVYRSYDIREGWRFIGKVVSPRSKQVHQLIRETRILQCSRLSQGDGTED